MATKLVAAAGSWARDWIASFRGPNATERPEPRRASSISAKGSYIRIASMLLRLYKAIVSAGDGRLLPLRP